MKLIKKTGIFNSDGEIFLHRGISVSWKFFSNKKIPEIPAGTPLAIDISLDKHTILSGEYGIVWATWDQRQAEVIFNALLAQNIASSIGKIMLDESTLLLIKVIDKEDTGEAIDFIWRKGSGLRLKPDWSYPFGEPNKSFEKWLNG
jgi:hypothetical protein